MISTPPTSIDLILTNQDKKQHTTLFCIKRLLDWIDATSSTTSIDNNQLNLVEKIKQIPAKKLETIVENPAIQLWCANIIRSIRHDEEIKDELFHEGIYLLKSILEIFDIDHKNVDNTTSNFLEIRESNQNYEVLYRDHIVIEKNKDEISFLANQPLLLDLLGDELKYPVEKQIKRVQSCFEKGRSFLSSFYPRGYKLLNLISAFATVDNPKGVITSCSTLDYDGLIVIAENNPPVLIAEQLIHEAAHIQFGNILNSNKNVSNIFSNLPAFYSPFTERARPAQKLAHGIFSYSEVLSMWISLKKLPSIKSEFFGLNSDEVQELILERIDQLQNRISIALRNLQAVLKSDEKNIWLDLFNIFLSDKETYSIINQASCDSNDFNIDNFEMLNNIEKAELLLANDGSKVSRISLALSETGEFSRLLDGNSYFCFSRELIISKQDETLNQFSNIISGTVSYFSNEDSKADAFVYVAQEPKQLRDAFDLDFENKSGSHFEIPDCCQEFFKNNWDEAQQIRNGDLASMLIAGTLNNNECFVELPWQLNAFAMYWSGGLTWHFPCSLDCKKTVSLINSRLRILQRINRSLCDELIRIQKLPLLWTAGKGMGLLENNFEDNQSENIHWDSISDIPKKLSETGLKINIRPNPSKKHAYNNILGENWKFISWG